MKFIPHEKLIQESRYEYFLHDEDVLSTVLIINAAMPLVVIENENISIGMFIIS